jgi:PTS system mannose-specific IID component
VRVPRATLLRVFWRCLFLQAAWNRRGMQNLGFAYAIDPALRRLYDDPVRRRDALRRHLNFFNCHPYMAGAIVGGAIHHEELVAAGAEPEGLPLRYKETLQGPLAAIGDGFFWTALRPFFGAVAAVGALVLGWPAIVATLVVYNAIHFALRAMLFRAGYDRGDAVITEIARWNLPSAAERFRIAGAVLCGLAIALVLFRATGVVGIGAAVAAAVTAAAGHVALEHGGRLLPIAYAAALVGIGVALAAGRLNGGF